MALFTADNGFVLEGTQLYGEEITPPEAVIREEIAKLGLSLFPGRDVKKYLHRAFSGTGIGEYTLTFGSATLRGERFSVNTRMHWNANSTRRIMNVTVILDGKDWNTDNMSSDNVLTHTLPSVYLPSKCERDSILADERVQQELLDFREEIFNLFEELGDKISKEATSHD